MIRGLYLSAVGMNMDITRQEIRSNNLANASTPGFARQLEVLNTFNPPMVKGVRTVGPVPFLQVPYLASTVLDMDRGSFQETGNPMDITVTSDGFIEIGQGTDRRYQRTISLKLDNGMLVTSDGRSVVGSNGPVRVGQPTQGVTIGRGGEIIVDGMITDMLRIVRLPQGGNWMKAGDGGYIPQGTGPVAMTAPQVESGIVEESNVNSISEMVEMISLYRHFEAGQKAVRAIDETLEKAVTEVGSVR